MSAIGELRKLEILSFLGSKIKELSREIGNLSYLKLLDLTRCFDLQQIPFGLLSSLSHLEELYMFGVRHVDWEPMEGNNEGANANLIELMSLSYLVALQIQIPNIKLLPNDLAFSELDDQPMEWLDFSLGKGNFFYHYYKDAV